MKLILTLITACLLGTWAGADEMARPNIILYMTDDQGWGDVSYHGLTKIQTPNMDAMAAGLRVQSLLRAAELLADAGERADGAASKSHRRFLAGDAALPRSIQKPARAD